MKSPISNNVLINLLIKHGIDSKIFFELVPIMNETVLIVPLNILIVRQGRKTRRTNLIRHHRRMIAGISLVVVSYEGLRDKFLNVVTINVAIGGWTITFDVESDLKEIEFLLHWDIDSSLKDSIDQSNLADDFVDSMPEMFTDEHAHDYSSHLIFDEKLRGEYVVHQMDPLHPNILYPSRMLKQKQQEKDEVQIHKFWQMFKQLHINITLADALILMPKYQKMLKALLSNKEKLQELANTPLNENCSAVILKKLPEKLGDPLKFLILCGFSELKYKAQADLGASINLMPLSVWKKLAGIARDVFAPVGKFTFPADFVIVDYESDHRVPFILGRPFLRTTRALIDVHGDEMIPRDGDERLILNMRHDTSSYSNQPQKESINLISVFNNSSKDFLEDLFSNQPSGNPTFPSHPELTLPEVQNIFDSEGGNVLPEKLLDLDSTKDLRPPLHVNPLSGSTTYSSSQLLEEFTDELALITFPPKYDDDLQFDVESDLKEIEFLLHQDIDSSLKDSIDQSNLANPTDNFVDSMPEKESLRAMFEKPDIHA
nr:reverse transcriptase domain-containing protein [Tanacetum cinerariifolium]